MKTRRAFFLAITCLTLAASARAQSPLMNFTNPPAPIIDDLFGYSLAAVGDKVLIGVLNGDPPATAGSDHGKAYLFNTNGSVSLLITNPFPKPFEHFGNAVAAMGPDKMIIAAYEDYDYPSNIHAGTVYLFSTNGTRLTTFTNPSPAALEHFGVAVAAVGGNKVLIGADQHADAGEAYIFDSTGVLLTTITNPSPADTAPFGDYFGHAVAAVGTDKLLIGAYQQGINAFTKGAAYLYDISGALLLTLTNPASAAGGSFGYAVAAVGPDKLLIGAPDYSPGDFTIGQAYLFDLNGNRLTTFTNPQPVLDDKFGNAVCAVGTDKVLIAAFRDDAGADAAGTCYLFDLNGALLNTYTNPTPQAGDYNGWAVAPFDDNRFIVGAILDNARGTDAGTAYLYSYNAALPNPTLRIFRTNANVAVAWPAPSTGWTLQASTNLATTNWTGVSNAVNVVGSENQVLFAPPMGNKYLRLLKP